MSRFMSKPISLLIEISFLSKLHERCELKSGIGQQILPVSKASLQGSIILNISFRYKFLRLK